MKHIGTIPLKTDRLILRRFTASDDEAMLRNWCADPEVTKYLMWPPHDSIEVTRQVLKDIWISKYDNADFYQWAIEVKDLGEPIGSIGVVKHEDKTQMVHIGYCIGRTWWRKGYMSEALIRLVRFFFEDVGANRIESRHDPRNPNSGRVMLKARLRYEGTSRESDWNNQGICDAANYAILARDYFNRTKAEVTIIPYEPKYHADMLFCYLSAKDAINNYAPADWSGLALKDDLLGIEKNYLERGDVFYLAIDEYDRVSGMIGTQTVSSTDLWLKRLFIKPELKGKGIGSKLLAAVEEYAIRKGITTIHTRFASWYREAAVFYPAKGFIEVESDNYLRHMAKSLM